MEIKTQKVAPTSTIHVKNAAGEPLYSGNDQNKPVRIIIHGPGSRVYGQVEARQTARALKRMQDNDNKIIGQTADEKIAEMAEDLTTLTVRFENMTYDDLQGAELFSAVYSDPELGFIPRQVSKFVADWGNFRNGSSVS